MKLAEHGIAVSRVAAFLALSIQQNVLQTARYKAPHLKIKFLVSAVTVSLRKYHGGKH